MQRYHFYAPLFPTHRPAFAPNSIPYILCPLTFQHLQLAALLRFSAFMAAIPCSLVAPVVHAKDGRRVGAGVSCCGVRWRNGRGGPGWKVLRFGAGSCGKVVLGCQVAASYGYMGDAGIGRVGAQKREGSASFLSFGFKKADSSQALSAMLPFVVAATAIAALANPATFSWVSKDYYAPALGGIMLSIGIRLSVKDFALAFQRPLPLSIGFMAQYVLKPILGLLIAKAFGAPPMFYAGFILMSCVAGAQLSSYASYLSKGDVALSLLLTSSTTISSVLFTPLLTRILIGSVVPVDANAMAKSILQVVLVPVTAGLLLNTYAKPLVNVIQPIMPIVAMFCTSLCIGSPLAINQSRILSSEGIRLILPILAFHTAAFTFGYWLSKIPLWRQEEEACRTISLCTGMQSSTLAGLLATQFLGSSHAVPPACSVVAMAIMGLYLGSFWGNGGRIRDMLSPLLSRIRDSGLTA